MADTKRNALANLAVRLGTDVLSLGRDKYPEIEKASRIVAELANVEDRRDGETNIDVLWRCNDCIARCRAIAEEGVGNNDSSV